MTFIKKKNIKGTTYLSEVRSIRVGKKVFHQHLRYIGKKPNSKKILELQENINGINIKVDATLLVFDQIATEIGLYDILGERSKTILCLAYAHCKNYQSVNKMNSWMKKTNVGHILGLKSVTEKQFLKALDDLESKNLSLIQQMIFSSVKNKYELQPSGIIYDVTNTYLYGKKCTLGKRGKSKEGRNGKPLIQIGLGTTEKEGIPVLHKIFKGNVHDSRTFLDMLTDFKDFGINFGLFVFYRGISSTIIQIILQETKWDVVCGLKTTDPLKKIIQSVKLKKNYQSIQNRVDNNGTIFYVSQIEYSIGKTRGSLSVCFNIKKHLSIKESLLTELMDAKKIFKTKDKVKDGLQKFFSKDGTILESQVQNHLEFKGFSLIFTTRKNISSSEIIRTYFDKDLIEKTFHVLKAILKLRPIRHWLSNRVTAHVFICYLSYLILSILKYKTRSIGITMEKLSEELEMAYKIFTLGSTSRIDNRVVTQNKTQQIILKLAAPKLFL